MAFQQILSAILILCTLAMTGCSSGQLPTYPTTGKVQFEDGSPVRFGSIEFYNRQHEVTARGTIDRDGNYALGTFEAGDGAVAGEHKVVIIQTLMPTPLVQQQPGEPSHQHHGRHVHKDYTAYSTSTLECVVEEGNNICNLTVSGSRR